MAIRITGGDWRGRRLQVAPGPLRPAQDRVRQAVFSILADRIAGARVLDLFAGTGAYGLEALSRGAASATWVEADRRTAAVLRRNVESLCGASFDPAQAQVVASDAWRFLARAPDARGYALVFADPPYDSHGGAGKKLLSALAARPILTPGGLVVLEQSARAPTPAGPGWHAFPPRRYGGTQVWMLALEAPDAQSGGLPRHV